MKYKIKFKKSVIRDLRKITKPEVEKLLKQITQNLPSETKRCPKLKDRFKGLRKYRIGNYRIIFVLLENTVLITRISHRKDIYKKL
ncbi:MAG: hypothetical protein APR63_05300 [Desulfuromonas sp. SDB]|nr:MAG: hypothetical protein APR63_05300 [Desulfuromonas sp. SDB]